MATTALPTTDRQYDSMPPSSDERSSLDQSMRYIFALVRRRLWFIVALLAISIAAAVLVTLLQTPSYTATSTVQINDQSESVLGEEMDSDSTANTGWDVDRFLNTQLEILRSRGLALRVGRRLNLFADERFYNAMEVESIGEGATEQQRENLVVALLQGNMRSSLPRQTRIAEITFTSTDPEISAQVANAYAEEFIQANLQRRYDSSSYARNFIEEQLQDARARLESSERELNAYAREAGLIRTRDSSSSGEGGGSTSDGSVTSASLSQLNEAANAARANRAQAEAAWQAEQAQPLLSSPTVLANPTVQSLMTQRSRLQTELAAAQSRYLADHPVVRELKGQLSATETQLTQTANSVRNSLRSDYQAAVAAQNELESQVAGLTGDTLAEQDRSVRYNTLAREADTNRSIYDGLLQRYRELNASAGIAASNLSIIDRAETPQSPSAPNLIHNILIGLVLGLVLAFAVVFLRDQLDDVIRVPEDVSEKIGMPLLGVIPYSEDDNPMEELADPKSAVSEAYNSLRGSLLYATPQGLPKVVLVTSTQTSEGKSTTSYAIARAIAKMGKRALLIDGDMRRPTAHRRYGIANDRGLSDLLTSNAPAQSVVQRAANEEFSVIASGPTPPSPTELLASNRFASILEELSAQYDCMIIDSPPVLGLADAPTMAALADGVIFVVESARSRRGMMKVALRRLQQYHPHILGAVMTKFDPSQAGHGYSAYYGYDYYRYTSDENASPA
ncbi:polysaccharide biosynthesis tyrosine autokinase [Croceicoccus sp. YJ47]|uniref:GumC family protein n=1 Tax=Croceicoccus sp. YJ47 TaxID=2798724 RepID=UPI001924518D|nr:polysaccharide biosynthesis tyrosine autokinase [Croceicoccus sp. YJ47]QQN72983.1 polysaccharide biosynthesis tyrosine autokinase [Croceicoccus sp. YJ47]